MAIKVVQNFLSSIRGALAVVMGQSTTNPNHAVAVQVDEADGLLQFKQKLPVAGAAPSTVVGTTGRLNQDVTYAISAGKTVIFHQLVPGVSVSVATAGAASVGVVGKAVTFTDKNDDSTTLTAMLALLAASPAANLVSVSLGTAVGGDTWDHLLTLANTPLYAAGTVPASLTLQMDENGNLNPEESEVVVRSVYRAAAARRFAGLDAGAVTVTSAYVLGFTGVNLLGKALYALDLMSGRRHVIQSVVDPVGATAGIVYLVTPLLALTDTVIVAYAASPLGYNSATDAQQTHPIAPPPKGVNGPAVLLSNAALVEVAGAYDLDVPVANYDEITVSVYIDAAAGDTYQIDLLARIDDQAAGDWINVNAMFTTGGTALGAAADPCALLTSTTTRKQFRELRVRRTKVNNNGNAAVRIWIFVGR